MRTGGKWATNATGVSANARFGGGAGPAIINEACSLVCKVVLFACAYAPLTGRFIQHAVTTMTFAPLSSGSTDNEYVAIRFVLVLSARKILKLFRFSGIASII